MNLRNLSITIAVLVVLSGIVWFVQRPSAPASTDARIGQPVLAADLATKATQLKLTDQGKTVTLTRQSDGSWRVTDYYDLPADFAKLSRLIDDLTSTKIQRLVTARPDRLERLEFKDTAITLLDAAGKEQWHLTLGKNAEGGGRFLRYGTEQKGYQASLTPWLDPEPKNWADPVLLNLKPDEIARVELSFADGGSVAASRTKKEDVWTAAGAPEGKRLQAGKITSLLGNLAPLRFSDTTAPDDANAVAARAHSRTVKLTTFAKKTYTVVLGRKPEGKMLKPAVPLTKPEAKPVAAPASAGTSSTAKLADESAAASVKAEPAKPKEPEFETIPAGPVFAFVTTDDASAPINGLMQKRAFEINEWAFTSLPATVADLWEDAPKMETKPVSAATPPVQKPAAANGTPTTPPVPPPAPKP